MSTASSGLAHLEYAEIRRAMRSLPKVEFFAHRRILAEEFFGWVFEDGDKNVLVASFDRSLRELLTHESRPSGPHFPKLNFDYGQIIVPSGLSLHVVSCERLTPIKPLSDLWQAAHDLSQAYGNGESWRPWMDSSLSSAGTAQGLIAAMSSAAKSTSMKECLQDLFHFAQSRGLALSPYFMRHRENMMSRDDDLVFTNPLYDPNIQGLPSSFLSGGGRKPYDRHPNQDDMMGGDEGELGADDGKH